MKIKVKLSFVLSITLLGFVILSCSSNPSERSKGIKSPKLFKSNPQIDNRGRHITSSGELRTLIIYAIFQDDNAKESESWKFSQSELPGWTAKMINNSTLLEFPDVNLTQYFYEMSNGTFMLYGDIYPEVIVPEYGQKHYKNISEVNYEILSRLDDEIDYSKYDSWSKGNDNKFFNQPDKKVDAIFIVYRNFENRLFFHNGWTGIAHLHLTKDIVTNDGVTISKGRLDNGSGIASRGGWAGFNYMKYVLAHEFGHFLFGSGHIENTTNLALMTGGPVWNASRGMHSWERSKLGWAEFIDIPLGVNSTIEIGDYHTTDKALRIKLSDREWYVLENHQKLSKHDWAKDKGIYIYHINYAHRFAPIITVNCADGNWDFEIDNVNKKLIKTIPNPFGKTEMNYRRYFKKKNYSCSKQMYGDQSAWGDKHDAFDLSYNNLLSPVSNPPSNNKKEIDFAIEIVEKKEHSYLVNIYFDKIYENTPPSKPQILGIEQKSPNEIYLKWLSNKEPDLLRYNIYLGSNSENNIKVIKQIPASKNDVHLEMDIIPLLSNKISKSIFVITAFDKSGKESVFSDFVEFSYDPKNKKWNWGRIEEY